MSELWFIKSLRTNEHKYFPTKSYPHTHLSLPLSFVCFFLCPLSASISLYLFVSHITLRLSVAPKIFPRICRGLFISDSEIGSNERMKVIRVSWIRRGFPRLCDCGLAVASNVLIFLMVWEWMIGQKVVFASFDLWLAFTREHRGYRETFFELIYYIDIFSMSLIEC